MTRLNLAFYSLAAASLFLSTAGKFDAATACWTGTMIIYALEPKL